MTCVMPATSSPRAAMSVATMTSYLPDLKPASASMRWFWLRLPCSTATEWPSCWSFLGDAVAAVLGPREDEHAVVLRLFQQDGQEVELLRGRHRVKRVRDGFRRGTALADLDDLRVRPQGPFGQPLDLGRQRGAEKEGLPLVARRAALHQPAHVGQETHVEHAVHLVEHEDFHVGRATFPFAGGNRATGRAWRSSHPRRA